MNQFLQFLRFLRSHPSDLQPPEGPTPAVQRSIERPPVEAYGRPLVSEPTRTLLLAEDDLASQRLLARGLRGLNGFKVVVVCNGCEALDYLQNHPVDVLVTDLQMPVMDGYQLIGEASARFPHIPIFVVSDATPEEHQFRPIHLGALLVFPKPARLTMLMEEIQSAVARPRDGEIRGLSLQSLLQVLEWEQKDCTLIVRSEPSTGLLYIREGRLIHGAVRDRQGLPAIYDILAWDNVQVELVNVCKVEASTDAPLPRILMEAAVARDHGHTDRALPRVG